MLESIFNPIIDAIAGLLAIALLLRFWMQLIRIRPPHQVQQFTFQLSDWLVKPLRRIVPGVGGYDWASLIGVYLVALLATALTHLALCIQAPELIVISAIFQVLNWIIYGWTGMLFLSVIFSWINPHAPLAPVVNALCYPLLRPIRSLLPPIGGLDFSPMVVLILLQIALRVIGKTGFPLP